MENTGSNRSDDGQFNIPHSLAFDRTGNVYITDTENHRIQKFTSDGTFLDLWGSTGLSDAQFVNPAGIAPNVR